MLDDEVVLDFAGCYELFVEADEGPGVCAGRGNFGQEFSQKLYQQKPPIRNHGYFL
jgi:hypothetical protein